MKYTLEQLRMQNKGYAYGAEGITMADVELVNRKIARIEQTRTEIPQELDSIIYTNKYGDYYPAAIFAGDVYNNGSTAICESGSAYIFIDEQNRPRGSIGGGAFPRVKPENMHYIGKVARRFWTFSTLGAGASQGLYFDAVVSQFELNERPENMREYTSENYDDIFVYDAGEDYEKNGRQYRYNVERKTSDFHYAWQAFTTREGLDELLNRYEAVPETLNGNRYWILKEKNINVWTQEEFDAITADFETLEYFNGSKVPHKYVKHGTELHRYILRANEQR